MALECDVDRDCEAGDRRAKRARRVAAPRRVAGGRGGSRLDVAHPVALAVADGDRTPDADVLLGDGSSDELVDDVAVDDDLFAGMSEVATDLENGLLEIMAEDGVAPEGFLVEQAREEPVPEQAVAPALVPAPAAPFVLRDNFKWGVFKFTKKPRYVGGACQPGWQVMCPFHKRTPKGYCTKYATLTEENAQGEERVLQCLKMWAMEAPQFHKARWHNTHPAHPGGGGGDGGGGGGGVRWWCWRWWEWCAVVVETQLRRSAPNGHAKG